MTERSLRDHNPYAAPESPVEVSDLRQDDPLSAKAAWIVRRALAFIVDYWLLVLLFYGLSCVVMLLSGHGVPGPLGSSSIPRQMYVAFEAVSSFAWFFYSAILEASPNGATLGKRLLRIQVVDQQGGRISLARAFLRAILKLLGFIAGFFTLALVPALFSRRRQTFHDRFAGTVVIYKPSARTPGTVDL